ncbi:MAG: EAL domain-containing protein [Candidatus Thiodiazotropha sp. (ex Dulcina madagascariensis)]|nr:EAL domain-containing protein [Candidatus Thiodiazotropha sp. (ex Dulcina madagascariensis)]
MPADDSGCEGASGEQAAMSVKLPIKRKQRPSAAADANLAFSAVAQYALAILLPLLLLIWGALFFVIRVQDEAVVQRLQDAGVVELHAIENVWRHELNGIIEDLRILVGHEELMTWLRRGDEGSLAKLRLAWSYFTASKRIYDQVRFLDVQGMERVRINYDGKEVRAESSETLQSKAHRYYFKEGIQLDQGEIYASPLDLNVENNHIEMPVKPMLRVASPVFFEGERRGLLILNFLAKDLLQQHTVHIGQSKGRLLMLNADGYYLRGLDASHEWGFMYPGTERAVRFQDRFPAVWQRMQQSDAGAFEARGDIFAFQRLAFPADDNDGLNLPSVREWTLLVRFSKEEIKQTRAVPHAIAYAVGTGVSLLLAVFSLLYARLSLIRQENLKSANNLGARLQAVMETAPDAILTFDANGRVESFNSATLRMFACSEAAFSRVRLEALLPDGYAELKGLMRKNFTRDDGTPLNIRREYTAQRFNQESFPLELTMTETHVQSQRLFIVIARDITDRRVAEEQFHRRVLYDDLTNLPNRVLLRTELATMISLSQRRNKYSAVLFMDLDNFKNINDSMGHMAGDTLLCRVAERLNRTLRKEDIVSRLGGDEFVVVLPLLAGDANQACAVARDVAEKIRQALNQPVVLDGHEYVTTTSIGIVLFPAEGMDADELLKQADTAMYRAKAAGRNTIRFFHPSMQAEVNDRLRVGKELRMAVEQGQLELYLQPQIDAQYECIVGAEALIRWHHPSRGLLAPSAFIPHAEELGLISEIGEWTLREGFRILKRMLKDLPCQGLECLAINISPRHFRSADFLSRLKALMGEFRVPVHRIELEITENLLLDDLEEAVDKMSAAKEMGIRFAIDDFGTGFSSLAYLKRLPVGRLKIDRSFIIGVDGDPHNAAIVETVLAMARIQQLAVTAEGVERAEERQWLMDRGCNHIQGYYYSHPLPIDDFVKFCQAFTADQTERQGRGTQ